MGVVPGNLLSNEPTVISRLGATTVRMGFPISTPAPQLAKWVEEYAGAGVHILLLAEFKGYLPTPSEQRNLATWAAAYGPDGTFWAGRNLPVQAALTEIEFGNETSYSYQWGDDSASAVASRAETYARDFRTAAEAVRLANPGVGLLAQADNGGSGNSIWVDGMFRAVPSLSSYVGGWTIHPYGPTWEARVDEMLAQLAAAGAPTAIPLDVTEWGLSTDNGRCLGNNDGWNRCMTYAEAASTLTSSLNAMRARYGSRLHDFYLYQAQDLAPSGSSTSRELYFGALQQDSARKGSYTTAVEDLLDAARPSSTFEPGLLVSAAPGA